jgi:hypothetical protein
MLFYLSVRSNQSEERLLGRSLMSRGQSCHWNTYPDEPPADTIWFGRHLDVEDGVAAEYKSPLAADAAVGLDLEEEGPFQC